MLSLFKFYYLRDRARQPVPVGRFLLQLFPPKPGQRIKLSASVILAGAPFGGDPALLLKLVERSVEGTGLDLQPLSRNSAQSLADWPAIHGLQRPDFEQQQIESSLDQVR